jgi:long-subunit acyl-CoA synthetase (AMP-forming)
LENEPFISPAVVLGDRRPFIAALIVAARQPIAEALKRDIENLSDEIIEAALWSQIGRVNARLEVYEQIRKIAVLRDDFPPEVRSINHFHKVKVDRRMVAERFGQEIDGIYQAAPEGGGL